MRRIFCFSARRIVRATALAACMALAGEVRGIVFVDAFAYGANNGTDWFHAYNSLKTAVEMSPPGSEIWVAEGVYYATALNDQRRMMSLR